MTEKYRIIPAEPTKAWVDAIRTATGCGLHDATSQINRVVSAATAFPKEEMVEKIAKRMYESLHDSKASQIPWEDRHEAVKNVYRADAMTAITVILEG